MLISKQMKNNINEYHVWGERTTLFHYINAIKATASNSCWLSANSPVWLESKKDALNSFYFSH